MTQYWPPLLMVVVWSLCAPGSGWTSDGNRLAYLDEQVAPYYVGRDFPKLVTPQWVGEAGVEAVVVLAIDDMKDTEPYENYLRPILDRLKQIDGRAPVSIMTCEVDPRDERLQQWIKEGVSLEAHTIDHPCPLLRQGDFSLAKKSYELCIDMLAEIRGNKPVAFRVPCCDSRNTPSPRFWKELFNDRTSAGHFLSIDSSVGNLFTSTDTDLPLDLTRSQYGAERFRRYLPSPGYINVIENYPYPYVIAHRCWEFPYAVPSDWQGKNMQWSANPKTIRDLKLALDATVIKQGVMTLFFHPKQWMRNDQVVELIEYATTSYAGKVKFLNFRESLMRMNQHLLAGQPLRDARGDDNGVRLFDVDNDGYLDVCIANSEMRQTRIWSPLERQWEIKPFPVALRETGPNGVICLRFGVLGPDGQVACIGSDRGWSYRDGKWQHDPTLLHGVSAQGESDTDPRLVRLRDLDGDGCCEWLDATRGFVYRRDQRKQQWRRLPYKIPNPGWSKGMRADAYIVDREGGDTGLRFFDVDQDGDLDVLFSNPLRCGLYLFDSLESGWVTSVLDVSRGNVEDASIFPSIVRPDGTDNGSWFHGGQLVFQNEDTYRNSDLVERTSLSAILGQYRQRMLVKQLATPGRQYATGLHPVVEPLVKIVLLLGSLMTIWYCWNVK